MKRWIGSLFSVVAFVGVFGCETGGDAPRDQVTIVNRLHEEIIVEHQVFEYVYDSRIAHWSATPVKAGETVVVEASTEEAEPPYTYTIHVTAGGVRKTVHVSQDTPKLVVDEWFMQL